jgi:hypothetical protein
VSDVAQLIADMVVAGVDPMLIGRVAQALAEREPVVVREEPARSAGADRTARWRERKASQAVTCDAGDVTVTKGVPPKERSPRPPKEITPSPNPSDHSSNDPVPTRILKFAKSSGFDRFWEAYPRKVGKGVARKSFERSLAKLAGRPDPIGVLLAALNRVKPTWDDPDVIPHPATWLNQERWDDEPELPPPQGAFEVARHTPARRIGDDLSLDDLKAQIAREAQAMQSEQIQ